jgi:hypothetical protein
MTSNPEKSAPIYSAPPAAWAWKHRSKHKDRAYRAGMCPTGSKSKTRIPPMKRAKDAFS